MIKIESFSGEYRWLSNFWPAQVRVYGEQYPSVEHAYQAAKSTIPEVRESPMRYYGGVSYRISSLINNKLDVSLCFKVWMIDSCGSFWVYAKYNKTIKQATKEEIFEFITCESAQKQIEEIVYNLMRGDNK